MNLLHSDTVVKQPFLLVAKVTQAVPLRRYLRVEGPDVVVAGKGRLGQELLVESATAEEGGAVALGCLGIEGPVERDTVFFSNVNDFQVCGRRPRDSTPTTYR